jgi:hypothetical protein
MFFFLFPALSNKSLFVASTNLTALFTQRIVEGLEKIQQRSLIGEVESFFFFSLTKRRNHQTRFALHQRSHEKNQKQ